MEKHEIEKYQIDITYNAVYRGMRGVGRAKGTAELKLELPVEWANKLNEPGAKLYIQLPDKRDKQIIAMNKEFPGYERSFFERLLNVAESVK